MFYDFKDKQELQGQGQTWKDQKYTGQKSQGFHAVQNCK